MGVTGHGYGHLSCNPHQWFGGEAGGSEGYEYGWPSGGTSEPDVAAQWLFDEASGSIVDEVSGLTLLQYKGASATITYRDIDSGYSSSVEPGIFLEPAGSGHTTGFYTLDGTSLALGTGDGTIEWVAAYESVQSVGTSVWILTTGDSGSALGFYFYYYDLDTTPKVNLWIRASDATIIQSIFTLSFNPFDGASRKHRVVIDRSGNLEYLIDGSSEGTSSLATLAGKTIPSARYVIGGSLLGALPVASSMEVRLYEWRHSLNATNNSGGPGGG